MQRKVPFWKSKKLEEMSQEEWESLCDGCGRCCMVKLEDEDTGDIHLTRLSCAMLNTQSCQCKNYQKRFSLMPDCIEITVEKVRNISWLPKSCAYRRVAEGRDLAWWHPLVSGTRETVHEAGISVRGLALSEKRVSPENHLRYIIPDFEDDAGAGRKKRR